MSCVEWLVDPGLSNRVGVEHDDYKTLAHVIVPILQVNFFLLQHKKSIQKNGKIIHLMMQQMS